MSQLSDKKTETKELLQLVSFKIGDEEFGIDILQVQEINRMMEITAVPNAPEFVEGVVNLRGRIIPVVDFRTRIGMKKVEVDNKTRIIVVDLESQVVGFIVDEVSEVLRIPKDITEPPPPLIGGVNSEYITAVGKLEDRMLILLDLEKVFSTKEMQQLESVS